MTKEVKFEDKMNRLETIVDELENDTIDIDKALKLYEEGLGLSKDLQKQLNSFEEKINKLSEDK